MKKVTTFIAIMMLAFVVVASNAQAQTPTSSRLVVSPYYQADSGSYTFIGVSHPSLSAAVSQIGLRLTAVGASATVNNYVEFTVAAGGTQRVFIVPTNHSVLNPTTISDSTTSFIAVSTGSSSGSIRAVASHVSPTTMDAAGNINNLSQLSFWGAVVASATSSGFAMEFIGDAHDSVAKVEPNNATQPGAQNGIGYGRGIN